MRSLGRLAPDAKILDAHTPDPTQIPTSGVCSTTPTAGVEVGVGGSAMSSHSRFALLFASLVPPASTTASETLFFSSWAPVYSTGRVLTIYNPTLNDINLGDEGYDLYSCGNGCDDPETPDFKNDLFDSGGSRAVAAASTSVAGPGPRSVWSCIRVGRSASMRTHARTHAASAAPLTHAASAAPLTHAACAAPLTPAASAAPLARAASAVPLPGRGCDSGGRRLLNLPK